MQARYPFFQLLVFMLFLAGSCDAMTATVAERCVLIDLQQERGREIFPMLDAFATVSNLDPELSHPINPRYIRGSKDQSRAEVAYRLGLGSFGALLTLFRFDENQDSDLVEAFDQFVRDELEPMYKVTPCAEVPDFEIPMIYQ